MKENKVYCKECKNYGNIEGAYCKVKTVEQNAVNRAFEYDSNPWEKNKNNDCQDFSPIKWFHCFVPW
jgi:hypothetical protein